MNSPLFRSCVLGGLGYCMRWLRFLLDLYILAHFASGCLSYVTALPHFIVTDLTNKSCFVAPSHPCKHPPSPRRLSRMGPFSAANLTVFEVVPLMDHFHKNYFLERWDFNGWGVVERLSDRIVHNRQLASHERQLAPHERLLTRGLSEVGWRLKGGLGERCLRGGIGDGEPWKASLLCQRSHSIGGRSPLH